MKYTMRQIKLHETFNLLTENNLRIDHLSTYTLGVFDYGKLIGTGTIYKNVIKLLAVNKDYRNENILAAIITELIKQLAKRKIYKYFVFTTPENIDAFKTFGFHLISVTPQVAYLENNFYPISEKLTQIASSLPNKEGSRAAIVMNCNPITNGHLFLIEHAAKNEDHVIIFLVEEDKSLFPFELRKKLIEQAITHLTNVTIIGSTEYIISSITFPSYFVKDLTDGAELQMELDAVVFNDYFMPIFNIDKRYVGTEPMDFFTKNYNETLKRILDDKLVIIERLLLKNQVVSATLVRKHFKENRLLAIKHLVPESTYQFLKSKEGKALLK